VADVPAADVLNRSVPLAEAGGGRPATFSIREWMEMLHRRRRIFWRTVGGLLLLCVLYCLVAPNQYEASAKVVLRMQPASALSVGSAGDCSSVDFEHAVAVGDAGECAAQRAAGVAGDYRNEAV